MAATQQQGQPFWKQTWFIESNWISTSTKWLLTFGGKAARIVLIICTLYMSAELYPGVTLPPGLNLAVFIILSFALDMGGLGLAQIAKTAREQGNLDGAQQGEKLSKWLIGIMIAGLVTVSLEHAVDMINFTKDVKNYIAVFWIIVEIALSIARVICAVNYGHVVHALEQSVEDVQAKEQNNLEELQAEVSSLKHEVSSLRVQVDTANQQVDTLNGQLKAKEQEVSTLQFQVSSGQMQMDTLRSQVDSNQVGDQTIVDSFKQRLDLLGQEVSTLQQKLFSKESEASRLQQQLTDRSRQVSTLEQTVSTLTFQVDTLKQKNGHSPVDTGHPTGHPTPSSGQQNGHRKVDSGHSGGQSKMDSRVIDLDSKKQEKDQEDQIKEMIQQGMSDRAIASTLGCSPTTVGKRRKLLSEQVG